MSIEDSSADYIVEVFVEDLGVGGWIRDLMVVRGRSVAEMPRPFSHSEHLELVLLHPRGASSDSAQLLLSFNRPNISL